MIKINALLRILTVHNVAHSVFCILKYLYLSKSEKENAPNILTILKHSLYILYNTLPIFPKVAYVCKII